MTDEHETDVLLDHQITQAYRRMDTALSPPSDVAARVARGVAARRRGRRAAAVGVAGVLVAVAGGAAVLSGTGHDADTVAVDPTAAGSFVLTRADGSTFEMSDLTLTCTNPDPGMGDVESLGAQRIWLYSPRVLSDDGKSLEEPLVYFSGIVDKIDGHTFTLPLADTDSEHLALILFAADPGTGASHGRANEVSSAEPGAAGTVVVGRASCDPTPVLEIEARTTLGSELERGTLDLSGSYR